MVTYSSSDGVGFTVSGSGQAPQLTSNFYIMFGRVEVTTRAAPGNGIVSSVVLQSDCLDEIDFEWLGADAQQVQTNYFGKGNTASYTRGLFHATPNNQADYLVYTIDWTADRIVWSVGSTVVRTLTYAGAEANQYPQTPMQVKFGSWSGGDPANAPGTIEWARGPTNYAAGPFTMYVKNIKITDYSTGTQYRYGDMTGSWQSIVADGGQVNGNLGASGSPYTTPTTTNGGSGSTGGNPGPAVSPTIPNLPSGWVMRPDGKIVPVGSASFSMSYTFSFSILIEDKISAD